MFLVTLLLLADIVASLIVGLMVVLCDVGVLGEWTGLTICPRYATGLCPPFTERKRPLKGV